MPIAAVTPVNIPLRKPSSVFNHNRHLAFGLQFAQCHSAQHHCQRLATGINRLPDQHRQENGQRDIAIDPEQNVATLCKVCLSLGQNSPNSN